jgi:hypothetical protein
MRSLLEQVADCCGLEPEFARKLIRGACARSGVRPEAMTPADLIRILPQVHRALSVFLDDREVAQKIAAMRSLVRTSWSAMPAVRPAAPETESKAGQEDPNTKSTS